MEAITIKDESLTDFDLGRHILKTLSPSCYPYTSFELLSDFKELDYTLDFLYRDPKSGAYKATNWFFGRISGEEIDLPENSSMDEPAELYIIDRSP